MYFLADSLNGFMVADQCPFYRGCLHRFSPWADHCPKSKHGTIHDHNTYCPTYTVIFYFENSVSVTPDQFVFGHDLI